MFFKKFFIGVLRFCVSIYKAISMMNKMTVNLKSFLFLGIAFISSEGALASPFIEPVSSVYTPPNCGFMGNCIGDENNLHVAVDYMARPTRFCI